MKRSTVIAAAAALMVMAACSATPIDVDTMPSTPLVGIEDESTLGAGTTVSDADHMSVSATPTTPVDRADDQTDPVEPVGTETPTEELAEDVAGDIEDILSDLDDLDDLLGDIDDVLGDLDESLNQDEGDIEE